MNNEDAIDIIGWLQKENNKYYLSVYSPIKILELYKESKNKSPLNPKNYNQNLVYTDNSIKD